MRQYFRHVNPYPADSRFILFENCVDSYQLLIKPFSQDQHCFFTLLVNTLLPVNRIKIREEGST